MGIEIRGMAPLLQVFDMPTSIAFYRDVLGFEVVTTSKPSGTAAEPLPDNAKEDKLRHLLYGHKPHVYRVIYRVLEKKKQVEVLHIRHGARGKLKPSDLV